MTNTLCPGQYEYSYRELGPNMNIHVTWLTYVRTGPKTKNRSRARAQIFALVYIPACCGLKYTQRRAPASRCIVAFVVLTVASVGGLCPIVPQDNIVVRFDQNFTQAPGLARSGTAYTALRKLAQVRSISAIAG